MKRDANTEHGASEKSADFLDEIARFRWLRMHHDALACEAREFLGQKRYERPTDRVGHRYS